MICLYVCSAIGVCIAVFAIYKNCRDTSNDVPIIDYPETAYVTI